jgi:Histone methylation protein DOT1
MSVFFPADADRRNTQTEKAGVIAAQLPCYGFQREEVGDDDLPKFGVRHAQWFAVEDQDAFHIGMIQAFQQDTFSDHTRSSGDNSVDFHNLVFYNKQIIKKLAQLANEIRAIEAKGTLLEETNFAGRSEAIDFLDFHIIDRIDGLLAEDGHRGDRHRGELELIRERAERAKAGLERIDIRLFERVRGEIAAGVRCGSLERMIPGLVDHTATDERGYDVLDAFVNGLFSDQPLPVETKALLPDMVSFHKTPVRVVMGMIELAEMDSGDVFVDIGSGLGQVVLLVNLLAGVRGMGIEYEPSYCAYASAIVSRLRLTDIAFVNADARDSDYSKGTVFFLYTPFEGRLLQDVLRLLKKQALSRMIRIFTYGPCSAMVAAENWCCCDHGIPGDPYQLCLFLPSGQPVYR